jgi:MFS family permease
MAWGWRIPFLLSLVLVAFSYFVRRKLHESPVFVELKNSGKASKQPLRDSFCNRENLKLVLIALFAATMGQGVVWYTGQFYALYYMQTVLKIDFVLANKIMAVALLMATPFFVVFGALSDRVGRKPLMMVGCFLALISWIPIYKAMAVAATQEGGPDATTLTLLIFAQVFFVTLVYGPIAAFLVEMFPTRIRYTSMSLPYHIGNGWFGGLLPTTAFAIVAQTGNMYNGLWYPIIVAGMTFVVGMLFVKETKDVDIYAND